MLYGSDTLVAFYKTFTSSCSYTRIGSVTQVDGLVQSLGTGSQRIGFALAILLIKPAARPAKCSVSYQVLKSASCSGRTSVATM